jgi:hypothetical protein
MRGVVVETDLRWGSGGCDGFEFARVGGGWDDLRWRCCGVDVEVLNTADVWLMPRVIGFPWYEILWPLTNTKLLRFAGFFFESLMVPKSAEICRFLCIRLVFFALVLTVRFGGELRAGTYLPRSSFYCFPISFGLWSCFLDSDGPFIFYSRAGVRG